MHLKDSNAILMTHTLAHFSSALLKEQMITSVKNVNNAGQINATLIDFSKICPKKFQGKGLIFTDCFSAKFAPKFPARLADFSANLPRKSRKI